MLYQILSGFSGDVISVLNLPLGKELEALARTPFLSLKGYQVEAVVDSTAGTIALLKTPSVEYLLAAEQNAKKSYASWNELKGWTPGSATLF